MGLIQNRRIIAERTLPQYADYLTLWENSNEDERILAFLERLATAYAGKGCYTRQSGDDLRILDIGVGDGRKTLPLVTFLKSKGQNVQLDVIEPEATCMTAFDARAAATGLKAIVRSRIPKRWHEVLAQLPRSHYDIVLSCHSIYEYLRYATDELSATGVARVSTLVEATLDCVAPGGVFCVIMGSADNVVTKMRAKFLPFLHNEKELDSTQLFLPTVKTDVHCQTEPIPNQWLDLSPLLEQGQRTQSSTWQRFLRLLFHVQASAIPLETERSVKEAIERLVESSRPQASNDNATTINRHNKSLPINDDALVYQIGQ